MRRKASSARQSSASPAALIPAKAFRRAVKTPGTKVAIQTGGDSQNLFVCDPDEIQQLQDLRREALERMEKEKVALPLPDR